MSILRSSSTSLALLTAIAVPVKAKILMGGDVNPGGTSLQPDPRAAGEKLYVGESGIGTLTVREAGQVSNQYGYIALQSGSLGLAAVKGANSQWSNSEELIVGFSGIGMLDVEAGGVVSNTLDDIGVISGSVSEATVTDTGSEWNNSSDLHVGNSGDGTLNVIGQPR